MRRCAITDGSAGFSAARSDWLVRRCASLEVDLVIVRERELAEGALLSFARAVVGATSAKVLVAGPVKVALAAGAAGVHLSSTAGSVAEVRGEFAGAYVTRSCHTLGEVVAARDAGVDAVLFGPVFGKWVDGVEVVAGVGVAALREAVEVAGGMPVYALGGVDAGNEGECGSAGVAGIRMFFGRLE